MKTFITLVSIVAMALLLSSCNLPVSVHVIDDKGAGTVRELLPDVPPMPGANKTDLGGPTLQISLLSSVLFVGAPIDYIFFLTPRSLQNVRDFYTIERMTPTGWDSSIPGCDIDKLPQYKDIAKQITDGWVCFFGKKQNDKTTDLLLIVIVPDDATKQTQIVYGRVTPTQATPTR